MAIAERLLAARFGADLVDHRTWVIAGDGCLMEGISHEACSLAGHLRLGKLIVLFDDNGISIDGKTSLAVSDDTRGRFEAYGWRVLACDGHDMAAVDQALAAAKESDRPVLVACRTVIGKGAPNKQGGEKVHGAPLGKDEVAAARQALGWDLPPFALPERVRDLWREAGARGQKVLAAAARRPRQGRPRRVRARGQGRAAGGHRRGDGRLQARPAAEQAGLGDAQGQRGGAQGPDRGGAGDDRRLGRPDRLEQHQDALDPGGDPWRLVGPLPPLRRARARDDGGDERDGAARRGDPLWRHLPRVHRLLPPRDPARGADAAAGDPGRHA
jgi:hypothetical protein